MSSIRKVVILGANGAMGSGAAAMFAAAGISTVLLARTRDKAEIGRARVDKLTKGTIPPALLTCGSYAEDLEAALGGADLVLEAVAEKHEIKREVHALVDRARADTTIVATVSSGLSITALAEGHSDGFQRYFLGVHLFNPPTLIVGCELIGHPRTDPAVVTAVRTFLADVLGREVVDCRDTPAFAGNRLGFKLLGEVAQLAEHHGVAYMDQLVGPHTGRVLAPLATIDLVGWDVHKAIVDNLAATTHDAAHACFVLPAYMQRQIDQGHLGRKTREKGGFFRVEGKRPDTTTFVLDPATGDYRLAEVTPEVPSVVAAMKAAIAHAPEAADRRAMEALCSAEGEDAELLRRILLGYISYGLGLVGEVVEQPRDIDRIMAFGFHWAPPSVLVDAIGAQRTVALLERAALPVPPAVASAATHGDPLFDEPTVDRAKFFVAR